MSLLLRAILVVGLAGLVLQGCGQEEAAAPAEAPAAAAAETSTATGGYEPTADERVPGITLDAAALEAQMNAAKAQAEAASKAN
ncbi:MAG: hypothetical protein RIR60_517 [Pseudomonadota bacterium]